MKFQANLNKFLQISLFSVSTYMSIMMFILIGVDLSTKIALALLAFIFELTKLTDLNKSTIKSKLQGIYFTSFTLKAILSVIASVGLILTLLSSQEVKNDLSQKAMNNNLLTYKNDVKHWEDELLKLDETVDLLNENLARNPEGYGLSSKAFVAQIQAIQLKKEEYYHFYQKAVTEDAEALSEESKSIKTINPANMFSEIGAFLKVESQLLKIIVFVSIMILIEVSLALTSINPTSKNVTPKLTQKKNMTQSFDLKSIPENRLKAVKAIIQIQSKREQEGLTYLTQVQIAERLHITKSTVNNVMRRYIRPLMYSQRIERFIEIK